jgi:hypothetical protein
MASTFSNLKIQLMATGENSGTWGTTTNTNLGTAIEQALVETATVTFASGNVTLTLTDTASAQDARALRLDLTGTTGGARDLIVPAIQKPYIVNNGTVDIITVKVSGQTGVAVPAGLSYLLYNNGTDVVNALNGISPVSGGTGTNTLTAEAVIIGNTTSNVKFVSPGTDGNVLTSNGTAWVSENAPAGGTLIPPGTVMLFAQTAAPTGFTKDTGSGDNHALRVVTGTVGSGGSVDFSTAFASQTPSGSVSVSISSISGSAGNTTLSTPQIPSHNHPGTVFGGGGASGAAGGYGGLAGIGNTGGNGAHSHPFSFSSGSGSGTFSGDAINLAVKYVDVIRATKD